MLNVGNFASEQASLFSQYDKFKRQLVFNVVVAVVGKVHF